MNVPVIYTMFDEHANRLGSWSSELELTSEEEICYEKALFFHTSPDGLMPEAEARAQDLGKAKALELCCEAGHRYALTCRNAGKNPFDECWILVASFPEPNQPLEEAEARKVLTWLFSEPCYHESDVHAYLATAGTCCGYDFDLWSLARDIAHEFSREDCFRDTRRYTFTARLSSGLSFSVPSSVEEHELLQMTYAWQQGYAFQEADDLGALYHHVLRLAHEKFSQLMGEGAPADLTVEF